MSTDGSTPVRRTLGVRELGASVSSGMSSGFSDSRIMWGSVANLVSSGVDKVAETANRVKDEVMRGN